MLFVKVKVTPPDGVADLELSLRTQPILIIFSRPIIDRLVKFFVVEDGKSKEIEKFLQANANLEAMQRTVIFLYLVFFSFFFFFLEIICFFFILLCPLLL